MADEHTGYSFKASRDPHGEQYLFRHEWESPEPDSPSTVYAEFKTTERTTWRQIAIILDDSLTDVGFSIGPDGVLWMFVYDSENDSYRYARSYNDGATWIEAT